jgi:hypothetical protein
VHKAGQNFVYALNSSMAVTAPVVTRSQLLNGFTQRPSVPNFIKIGQEIWKIRLKFIYGRKESMTVGNPLLQNLAVP